MYLMCLIMDPANRHIIVLAKRYELIAVIRKG